MISRAFAVACSLTLLGTGIFDHQASAQEKATPPSEPYQWRSVAIVANGFINGVVYGRAPGGPAYMNTDMGGTYRLDREKNEWVCLTDWIKHDDWSLNQMGAETVAVDPNDANRVYAGIGTYMGPSAVLRSTDQGRTWQRTNVPFVMNGNGSARNSGQRMNVDPNEGSRLLYGTRTKGLYQSADHGETWTAVEGFPTTGETTRPARDTGVTWTLYDAASATKGQPTPVAYAGVCTTQDAKIFRTTDGKTWQPVPGQPGGGLLATRAAISGDGKTMFLTYLTSREYPGPYGADGGAVYRVDDPSGAAPVWTEVTPVKGNFGWSGVSLDPTNPQTVYVTTICRYGTPGDDIYRSTDNGKSWKPLNIGKHRDDTGVPYVRDIGVHWTGDVQVNPQDRNEAMFTTGYGLYRTSDLQSDEPTWKFYNNGFEQSAVLELISPRTGGAHLISAIGDRDGYRHEDLNVSPKYGRLGQRSDFGQTESRSMGTCNDIDLAYDKPDILARVGAGSQYSNDGGITWKTFGNEAPRNGFAESGQRERGPSGGTIALAPDASSVVWAPSRHEAMMATRDGDGWSNWTKSTGLPVGNTMIAADFVKAGTFYARSADGIYQSTDGGKTFAKIQSNVPEGSRWFRATPGKEGHLWLTAGEAGEGGLWRSTDGGKTWKRCAPEQLVVAKQVGYGAPAPGRDYPAIFVGGTVGEARGFFRSDDEGATWVRVNDDQHQYGNVIVINGDARVFGRLYVGTNGRGILYGERAAGAPQPTAAAK
ncbi:MAG TPA: hypothetical protein VF624_18475 [Tepidisphaeraceae bacterium]|jgi:photosystem II stability/assembly factor-like uncharacterized protein